MQKFIVTTKVEQDRTYRVKADSPEEAMALVRLHEAEPAQQIDTTETVINAEAILQRARGEG